LALNGGEWSALRTGPFTIGETTHITHWIVGWVDPIAHLDVVGKRKILSSAGNRTPIAQAVVGHYTAAVIESV